MVLTKLPVVNNSFGQPIIFWRIFSKI